MKKIVFWLALIVGILALIGSCAKKEEEDSTAALGGCGRLTTVSACSSTPSGSITSLGYRSIWLFNLAQAYTK